MTVLVALAICGVVGAIAGVHAYWAVGGRWPAHDATELARGVVGDGRTRMPSAGATALVAAILLVVAIWPLFLAGVLTLPLPRILVVGIGIAMAVVFLLRGIAGYLPAWRRRFGAEPFATRDVRLFSPLCLMLAVAFAVVLSRGESL